MGARTGILVARAASVGVETLCNDERRGVLPRPLRAGSNRRVDREESAQALGFMKPGQEPGFSPARGELQGEAGP